MYRCDECHVVLYVDVEVDPWQTGKVWYRCENCGNEGMIDLSPDPMDASHTEDEDEGNGNA